MSERATSSVFSRARAWSIPLLLSALLGLAPAAATCDPSALADTAPPMCELTMPHALEVASEVELDEFEEHATWYRRKRCHQLIADLRPPYRDGPGDLRWADEDHDPD